MKPIYSTESRLSVLRFLNATVADGFKLHQRHSAGVGSVRKCFIVERNVRRKIGERIGQHATQNNEFLRLFCFSPLSRAEINRLCMCV